MKRTLTLLLLLSISFLANGQDTLYILQHESEIADIHKKMKHTSKSVYKYHSSFKHIKAKLKKYVSKIDHNNRYIEEAKDSQKEVHNFLQKKNMKYLSTCEELLAEYEPTRTLLINSCDSILQLPTEKWKSVDYYLINKHKIQNIIENLNNQILKERFIDHRVKIVKMKNYLINTYSDVEDIKWDVQYFYNKISESKKLIEFI